MKHEQGSSFSEGESESGESREQEKLNNQESDKFEFVVTKSNDGVFPTFFVFLDLPKHIEFRSQNLPLLKEGTIVEFNITLKNFKDPTRNKKILGPHMINRSILKYGGKRPGLTQYIEWKSMKI